MKLSERLALGTENKSFWRDVDHNPDPWYWLIAAHACCGLLYRYRRYVLYRVSQWRRPVVKHGGRGQSGQAIKLFQITPSSVNSKHSTIPVPDSDSVYYRRLQNLVLPPFLTKVFHPWWCETCRVIQQQFWMKNVTFSGVKTYSDRSYIFPGGED